jgi:hypothetical protein
MLTPQISWLTTPTEAASKGYDIAGEIAQPAPVPRVVPSRLTVSDIRTAHDGLVGRGIDVSDVWHGPPFPVEARQPGPDPEHASYGSFCSFSDPDGNAWLVQEVTTRLPGRV